MTLKTFETERLIIRPLTTNDLDELYPLIYADLEVRQYFTSFTTYEQVEQSHLTQVRKNKAPDNQGFGYWVATHKPNGHIIGKILMGAPQPVPWIRLAETSDANPIAEEVELGYAFGKAHWGQGYATETCQAIVRYAFEELDLRRFINLVHRVNNASIALMKRLGFRVEDNLHSDYDTVVGILTQTDWRAR